MPKTKRKSSEKNSTANKSMKIADEGVLKDVCIEDICNDKTSESTSEHLIERSPPILTAAHRAQFELNRQRALLIRQDKANKQKIYNQKEEKPVKVIRVNDKKLIDTGSGFYIEQSEDSIDDLKAPVNIVTEPAPLVRDEQPFCNECLKPFNSSYLQKTFDFCVCDNCRDSEDKHCLITKTDAKTNYLLNDCDIDKRDPPLKYILRKNPHNERWGDMKLYLKLQIEKRALEKWETEEKLENAIEQKEEKSELMKQKKYKKKMKELRMNVRSSLYTKISKFHEHEYGDEVYISESDEYKKTCSSCGHSYLYEKM